jgi:hypothetical protein
MAAAEKKEIEVKKAVDPLKQPSIHRSLDDGAISATLARRWRPIATALTATTTANKQWQSE